MKFDSELNSYLRTEQNSQARELLLTSRLIHDLTVAAAARNYDLLLYTPTVDCDGFDLIVDDRDRLLPLQLKSVIHGGKAGSWSIHRRLLRPNVYEMETFGFEPSPHSEGRGGGVVLIDVEAEESTVKVWYRYTDIRVLTAFWLNLIHLPKPSQKRLEALRTELSAEGAGKVKVPKSAFLRVKSAEHLLAIMGMHSRYNTSWPNLLYDLARFEFQGVGPQSAPAAKIKEIISSDLAELCVT